MNRISRFGERGGIGNAERNVQHFCKRAGKERFAASCRTDQQNIALLHIHIILRDCGRVCLKTFVMVVDGDGEDLFRLILTDNELVEFRLDFRRLWNLESRNRIGLFIALRGIFRFEGGIQNFFAGLDAIGADRSPGGAGDDLPDRRIVGVTSAEGTAGNIAVFVSHCAPLRPPDAE